ncbi:MAG: response regulator [Spirochaetia bacterium]
MNKKIFIVEDEMILNEQLKRFLLKYGYSVEMFVHGEPCLERLDSGTLPDLILMDINLGKGRMSGPEVTEKIYENYDIPVVLHSAYTDKKTLDTTKDMIKYGYIQKVPGNEQFILATVEMALKLHSTESELRESEEFHRTILGSISDTVLLTNETGSFVYICPNVNVIFGYSPEQVKAFKSISDFFGDPLVSDEDLREKGEVYNIKRTFADAHGVEHVLLVNVKSVNIKGGTRLYTFRDITELSRKEEELKRSERMYRELSTHLQNIREEQNAELSREIHDDLGQSLTALRMNITFLEQSLEEQNPDETILYKTVHDMERIIETTVKKVRKISTELRPSVIDAEGIMEALEWQVEEFRKNFNISVTLSTLKQDVELGRQKSLHVFRIVQESLTNCVRHSGATKVHISTAINNGVLKIVVRDNGYGFNVDELDGSMSFGFIGMKERAKQCAGSLDIESKHGTGTKVKLKIPVDENEVR